MRPSGESLKNYVVLLWFEVASPDMSYSQNTMLKSREERKTGLQDGLGEERKFVLWRVRRKHIHTKTGG